MIIIIVIIAPYEEAMQRLQKGDIFLLFSCSGKVSFSPPFGIHPISSSSSPINFFFDSEVRKNDLRSKIDWGINLAGNQPRYHSLGPSVCLSVCLSVRCWPIEIER